MKRMIEKIKNSEYILIFLIISLILSIYLFNVPLNANDELWNFSNIYKMTNGFKIYQDLNVIVTPLFFYIGNFLFKILGDNYLIYRIYNRYLINVCLFLMIYKIFRKMEIKKLNAIVYTTFSVLFIISVTAIGEYGILAIAIALIGIQIEIIKSKGQLFNGILQGICVFLVFMAKQNIGIFYLLGILVYKIIQNNKWRTKLKEVVGMVVTFLLGISVFAIYLKNIGSLEAFLNYTIGGIGEFAKQNLVYNFWNILPLAVEMCIDILFIVLTFNEKIKWKNEKVKNNIRLLGTISFFMVWQAYPIVNISHVISGSIVFIIFFMYLLETMILKELLEGKTAQRIQKGILILVSMIMAILSITHNVLYVRQIGSSNYYFRKDSPYYGALASKETIDEINLICAYIQSQNENHIEVKVISYYANLYMNVLGKNNGDMDLPFYGNLGKGGENGMIQKIEELKDTKILILTQEDTIYQESKKVTDYIRNHLLKEGEIGRFSIYQSN